MFGECGGGPVGSGLNRRDLSEQDGRPSRPPVLGHCPLRGM